MVENDPQICFNLTSTDDIATKIIKANILINRVKETLDEIKAKSASATPKDGIFDDPLPSTAIDSDKENLDEAVITSIDTKRKMESFPKPVEKPKDNFNTLPQDQVSILVDATEISSDEAISRPKTRRGRRTEISVELEDKYRTTPIDSDIIPERDEIDMEILRAKLDAISEKTDSEEASSEQAPKSPNSPHLQSNKAPHNISKVTASTGCNTEDPVTQSLVTTNTSSNTEAVIIQIRETQTTPTRMKACATQCRCRTDVKSLQTEDNCVLNTEKKSEVEITPKQGKRQAQLCVQILAPISIRNSMISQTALHFSIDASGKTNIFHKNSTGNIAFIEVRSPKMIENKMKVDIIIADNVSNGFEEKDKKADSGKSDDKEQVRSNPEIPKTESGKSKTVEGTKYDISKSYTEKEVIESDLFKPKPITLGGEISPKKTVNDTLETFEKRRHEYPQLKSIDKLKNKSPKVLPKLVSIGSEVQQEKVEPTSHSYKLNDVLEDQVLSRDSSSRQLEPADAKTTPTEHTSQSVQEIFVSKKAPTIKKNDKHKWDSVVPSPASFTSDFKKTKKKNISRTESDSSDKEMILKSYHIYDNVNEHDPGNLTTSSYDLMGEKMDQDIYKTYINPEGYTPPSKYDVNVVSSVNFEPSKMPIALENIASTKLLPSFKVSDDKQTTKSDEEQYKEGLSSHAWEYKKLWDAGLYASKSTQYSEQIGQSSSNMIQEDPMRSYETISFSISYSTDEMISDPSLNVIGQADAHSNDSEILKVGGSNRESKYSKSTYASRSTKGSRSTNFRKSLPHLGDEQHVVLKNLKEKLSKKLPAEEDQDTGMEDIDALVRQDQSLSNFIVGLTGSGSIKRVSASVRKSFQNKCESKHKHKDFDVLPIHIHGDCLPTNLHKSDFFNPLNPCENGRYKDEENLFHEVEYIRNKRKKLEYFMKPRYKNFHTNSDSVTTEKSISEGEIKCQCNVSLGEVHRCNLQNRPNRRKPRQLFESSGFKTVRRRRTYFDNWITYYVSNNSPSINDTSISTSTT